MTHGGSPHDCPTCALEADLVQRSPGLARLVRRGATFLLGRAVVSLVSGALLGLPWLQGQTPAPHPRALALLVLAVAWLAAGVALCRARSARLVERVERAAVGVDLLWFAGTSMLWGSDRGTGTAYGLMALLVGPLRWGWRGLLVTGLPVGVVASVWPQLDASGAAPGAAGVWTLIAVIGLPAVLLGSFLRRGAERLACAQGQFQAAFDHGSIGMAVLDADGIVLQANPCLVQMLGERVRPGADLRGRAADPGQVSTLLREVGTSSTTRAELELTAADGSVLWAELVLSRTGPVGTASSVVAQVDNITERMAAQRQLRHRATHDVLTGLSNQAVFHECVSRSLTTGTPTAVIFVDLDRFKTVNDSLGHGVGDQLLRIVADRLQAAVRPGDTVARTGGDEFVVHCDAATEIEAQHVAQRLLDGLRPPVRAGAHRLSVSGSVGVRLTCANDTVEAVLRDADTAMYAAKAAGGDQVKLFVPAMREQVVHAHNLEVGLQQALARNELFLAYEPVVDDSGQAHAYEALLRWNRDGVRVPPQEMIAVAEKSGLIEQVGEWVLDRALSTARSWPTDVAVHVNVSARQLTPTFTGLVAGLLRRHRVAPERLCLELTETAMGAHLDEVVARLSELRELGVTLAIDDFGVGHASLTYLSRLPVHLVKIDRSFISGLPDEPGSVAIVSAVVAMARAHGLVVVAEGVETPQQERAARRLGCALTQGFLHLSGRVTDRPAAWSPPREGGTRRLSAVS